MNPILKQGFFVLSLFLIVSCAVTTPKPVPTTEQLNMAAQKLWAARIRQDWNQVFDLTDKNYQKNYARSEFTSEGGLKKVLSFQIKDIHQTTPFHAETLVSFKIKKMGYLFNPVIKEFWVYEKRAGWVLDKTRMQNKKPL